MASKPNNPKQFIINSLLDFIEKLKTDKIMIDNLKIEPGFLAGESVLKINYRNNPFAEQMEKDMEYLKQQVRLHDFAPPLLPGDTYTEFADKLTEKDLQQIHEIIERGGRVVIPANQVGRLHSFLALDNNPKPITWLFRHTDDGKSVITKR